MPDEPVEQSASVIPGAAEAAIEAPAGVVEGAVEAVAGDGGTVATQPVTFDLSSDDGIRAALEANPTLAGYIQRQAADAANTARQRRDAELRREQGTVEVAQQYTQWLAEQIANGADPAEIGRQTPLYVKANHDTIRTDFARALLQQAAEGDETAKGLLDNLTGDPDEAIRVAQVALDASIKRARAAERAALTFDDVMATPQLKEAIEAYAQAKVAAELKADAVEAARLPDAPRTTGSAPGSLGMNQQTAFAMTPEQAARLSDEQFAEWKRLRMATA